MNHTLQLSQNLDEPFKRAFNLNVHVLVPTFIPVAQGYEYRYDNRTALAPKKYTYIKMTTSRNFWAGVSNHAGVLSKLHTDLVFQGKKGLTQVFEGFAFGTADQGQASQLVNCRFADF